MEQQSSLSPTPPSRPRTPSRNGNKVHHLLKPSLSRRESAVSLRASAQVTSTGIHTKAAIETASDTPPAILSSASSISNVDTRDQILTSDSRSEVNEPEDSGITSPAEGGFSRDEEAQRQLRDHLRRTLSQQVTCKSLYTSSSFLTRSKLLLPQGFRTMCIYCDPIAEVWAYG